MLTQDKIGPGPNENAFVGLLGRRARKDFLMSEAPLRHEVKEHVLVTKLLLCIFSDSRTEVCLTHLKIFARSLVSSINVNDFNKTGFVFFA